MPIVCSDSPGQLMCELVLSLRTGRLVREPVLGRIQPGERKVPSAVRLPVLPGLVCPNVPSQHSAAQRGMRRELPCRHDPGAPGVRQREYSAELRWICGWRRMRHPVSSDERLQHMHLYNSVSY